MENLSLWEQFKLWLAGIGKKLFAFARTLAGQFYEKYKDRAVEIVRQVATEPGLTGQQRLDKAVALFLAEVPGAATYLVITIINMAYAEVKSTEGEINVK